MRDLPKYIITTLITLLISFLSFWFVESQYYITLDDVDRHSQYAKDRILIFERLTDINDNNKELAKTIKEHTEMVKHLQIQLAVIAERLDRISNRDPN